MSPSHLRREDPDPPAGPQPPFTAAGFLSWAEAARWVYAKTMPAVPHEYCLRREQAPEDFDRAVCFIRAHGWRASWGRAWHTYYTVGGWKLWSMGWPVGGPTILINRALLNPEDPGYDRALVAAALRSRIGRWAEEALVAADRRSLPMP